MMVLIHHRVPDCIWLSIGATRVNVAMHQGFLLRCFIVLACESMPSLRPSVLIYPSMTCSVYKFGEDGANRSFGQGIRMYRDAFNPDLQFRAILLIHLDVLHLPQCLQTLIAEHMSKHGILAVQMGCGGEGDEELRGICAGPFIRHADDPARVVPQGWSDLVLEWLAPYRDSAFGSRRRRAGLDHEGWDETVEEGAIIVAGGAEGEEVLWRRSVSVRERKWKSK
jgi:hypothetical protein